MTAEEARAVLAMQKVSRGFLLRKAATQARDLARAKAKRERTRSACEREVITALGGLTNISHGATEMARVAAAMVTAASRPPRLRLLHAVSLDLLRLRGSTALLGPKKPRRSASSSIARPVSVSVSGVGAKCQVPRHPVRALLLRCEAAAADEAARSDGSLAARAALKCDGIGARSRYKCG